MAVVLGGGSGFIGSHIRRKLISKGYKKIINVSRRPGTDQITWTDLQRYGLPDDCKAVVNLAGANLFWPFRRWTTEFKKEVIDSHVETTRTLAKAVSRSEKPPQAFVLMSAVGYYGTSTSNEITETSPPGQDYFSELCMQNEKAAMDTLGDKVRTVIVRAGMVLGRDGGAFQGMFYPFFLGVGGKVGSGKQWFPWIHVADIAGIVAHAIEDSNVQGVLNGVAPDCATNEQFTQTLARALWRPAVLPVPAFVIRTLLDEERANLLLKGPKILPKRTVDSGYVYSFPDLKSACKDLSKLIYTERVEL